MNETFRLRRFYRDAGIVGLLFFTAMLVLSIYFGMTDVLPAMRIWFFCMTIGLWGGMSLLPLWGLLAYWREQTIVSQHHLTSVGLFRTQAIDFSEVIDAHWRFPHSGGSIVLRTPTDKKTIDFGSFEWNQRAKLIRLLKNSIPDSVQSDWKMFCYKIAIRVTKPLDREPKEGELLITRRRWDWYFIPLTVASAIYGILLWKWNNEVIFFVAPVFFILLWVYLRLSTPPKGFVSKRISFRGKKREFYILLCWPVLIFGGMILIPFFKHNLFVMSALIVNTLILYVIALVWSSRFDRRKRQHDLEAAEEAVKEWELFEQKPA